MRFRYDTCLQPVEWYSSGIRFSENNLAKIVPFATRVSILTAILPSAKADQRLGNLTHIKDLVAKFPINKRVKWARHAAMDFSAWLTEYANLVCTTVDVEGKDPRRRLLHASIDQDHGDQQGRLRSCPISGGQHAVGNCREFNGASPTDGAGMRKGIDY